jgi:two-component system sensor histidine kinase RegB
MDWSGKKRRIIRPLQTRGQLTGRVTGRVIFAGLPYNGRVNTLAVQAPRTYSPSLDNLRTLLVIRSLALLGQTAVLAYVLVADRNAGGLWGLTLSLLGMALITVASLWRTTRPWPVADREFLAQLLVDVVGWTALMYFSGGANNPFVSYYIVPLVIAAAVLPWRDTWLIAGSSLVAYSALLYYHLPFPLFTPHGAMGHGAGASVHILGMWFNFLFSAGLITYFVVRMAATLRQQEALAVARREDQLRNDQIMAVAALAAGTAHELGTPLSTMTVLVDEMAQDDTISEQSRKDCELLKSQLTLCKNTLAELSRTAELNSVEQTRVMPVGEFARTTLERWAIRRPGVVYSLDCRSDGPLVELDATLPQALENLLNNAADTGSEEVDVTVSWNGSTTHIAVRDWGPGIPADKLEQLGKPVIHADRTGLGIGLMLSQASVIRHGGSIELRNHRDGGTVATLSLPIARVQAGVEP